VRLASRAAGVAAVVVGVLVGALAEGTAAAVVGVLVSMVGFQAVTRAGVAGTRYVLAAVVTTGGLAVIAWQHGLTATELGLGRNTLAAGLAWSAGIVLVVGAAVATAGTVPRLHHLFADARLVGASGGVTARRVLFDIPFGTVLVEEFAFRGVLFALVTGAIGTAWAVVVTSALFGAWHISPAAELHESHSSANGSLRTTVISTVLFTGLAGVVFAALRLWTHSLLPPAAAHWAANSAAVAVGWRVNRRARISGASPTADP
jgi:uncharacterized protein